MTKKATVKTKKNGIAIPDLQNIVFTKISLNRPEDEFGIAKQIKGNKHSIVLNTSGGVAVREGNPNCTLIAKVDLSLEIVNEEDHSVALAASVSLQGFFPLVNQGEWRLKDLESAIDRDASIYKQLANIIYPAGINKLKLLIYDANFPIPKLPLSFITDDLKHNE